jgi:hypothetical protein
MSAYMTIQNKTLRNHYFEASIATPPKETLSNTLPINSRCSTHPSTIQASSTRGESTLKVRELLSRGCSNSVDGKGGQAV